MSALRFLVYAALAGCAGDVCIDNVCANPDEERVLPGPCIAHSSSTLEGRSSINDVVFTYDDGLLVHADYTFDGWGGPMLQTQVHSEIMDDWSYDSARQIERMSSSAVARTYNVPRQYEQTSSSTFQWLFDAQAVTFSSSDSVSVYDRNTFAFLPSVGIGVFSPRAELGLQRRDNTTYTWTRDAQTLTRTSGSAANVDTFVLDDRDRIVSADFSTTIDGSRSDVIETWQFDASGRLVEHLIDNGQLADPVAHTRYHYDRAGNLIKEHDEVLDADTIYSYACW